MVSMHNTIDIRAIRQFRSDSFLRVEATVAGDLVWFETGDADVRPFPEAFISAFLLPAMFRGAPLLIEGEISPPWRANLAGLMKIFESWWGYPSIPILSAHRQRTCPRTTGKTALFFTGGVDSFYSLLKGDMKVDYLVYVHGFDIPLLDQRRFELLKRSLDVIAAQTQTRLMVIRSNLREHPLFTSINWEKTHGGALASIAHILEEVKTFIVSSSYPNTCDKPFGSHFKTDPLWATDDFSIRYMGGEYWRWQKLAMIADHPLVQRHLHVCWENRDQQLNCSRCEKCLRTMVSLVLCGKLAECRVFTNRDSIAMNIHRIGSIDADLISVYEKFLDGELPTDIRGAIEALIERSLPANG